MIKLAEIKEKLRSIGFSSLEEVHKCIDDVRRVDDSIKKLRRLKEIVSTEEMREVEQETLKLKYAGLPQLFEIQKPEA